MSVAAEQLGAIAPARRLRRVLLVTEGTYPYHWGGLSTWCHSLIEELADVEFSLIAISDDPFARVRFPAPPNLVRFRAVPLWGVRNAWELDRRFGARATARRLRETSSGAIRRSFLPAFEAFVGQLLGDERDDAALAGSLHVMYRYFLHHDFDRTFRSELVWRRFTEMAESRFPALAAGLGYEGLDLTIGDMADMRQWVYHWLFPISQPVPEVDVAHATMGGICALVGVVCKLEHGAGFLLSEHGIYLREAYLAEHASRGGLFGKVLKLAFARRLTEVAYALADAIAPCCDYNHRWERRLGVPAERIHTAYYGLDPERFRPLARSSADGGGPVVAWAGRIDPLKDVETLLGAAAVVRRERPDVRFRLYGAAPPGNEEYHERCLALYDELALESTVSFEGFSPNVVEAFARADVVVLSSISEGFPYSTLEAMLCGKPVVATSVGGLGEQVTPECGRVVPPRDPEALGQALVDVLEDPERCRQLARNARERSATLFGIDRFRQTHRAIYHYVLAQGPGRAAPPPQLSWAARERARVRASALPRRRRRVTTHLPAIGALES